MERLIYLDTHVVVWLYAGETGLFSPRGLDALQKCGLFISPAVELELQYLKEVKKTTVNAQTIISFLSDSIGLEICGQEFSRVISESLKLSWTRDPFDRIITAQARSAQAPLLTKDTVIRKHYAKAFWD